jgi:hypothetical protein
MIHKAICKCPKGLCGCGHHATPARPVGEPEHKADIKQEETKWIAKPSQELPLAADSLPVPHGYGSCNGGCADGNKADVRVVRHVNRPVLGSEEENLISLPVTDDRNQNPDYDAQPVREPERRFILMQMDLRVRQMPEVIR